MTLGTATTDITIDVTGAATNVVAVGTEGVGWVDEVATTEDRGPVNDTVEVAKGLTIDTDDVNDFHIASDLC